MAANKASRRSLLTRTDRGRLEELLGSFGGAPQRSGGRIMNQVREQVGFGEDRRADARRIAKAWGMDARLAETVLQHAELGIGVVRGDENAEEENFMLKITVELCPASGGPSRVVGMGSIV